MLYFLVKFGLKSEILLAKHSKEKKSLYNATIQTWYVTIMCMMPSNYTKGRETLSFSMELNWNHRADNICIDFHPTKHKGDTLNQTGEIFGALQCNFKSVCSIFSHHPLTLAASSPLYSHSFTTGKYLFLEIITIFLWMNAIFLAVGNTETFPSQTHNFTIQTIKWNTYTQRTTVKKSLNWTSLFHLQDVNTWKSYVKWKHTTLNENKWIHTRCHTHTQRERDSERVKPRATTLVRQRWKYLKIACV